MAQKKRLRFYLDTEFSELPGSIELISIGISCDNQTGPLHDNGSTFYAESTSFNSDNCNDWVKENVLTKLKFKEKKHDYKIYETFQPGTGIVDIEMYGPTEKIKERLLEWIRACCNKNGAAFPEFWAYFADYDWVVFCWIFGTMMDLPESFPKYCLDLKQEMHRLELTKEWKQENAPDPEGEHNALEDAKWNKRLHRKIEFHEMASKDPDAR